MNKLIILILVTINIFAWEINTHRAIDKMAIQKSQNLTNFLNSSGLKNYIFKKDAIVYDGYSATYIEYIVNKDKGEGEKSGVSKWSQTFTYNQKYTYTKKATVSDLIEAGTILEDAMWQGASFAGNGRFNNHFYEAQNNGHELTYGYGFHVNAVEWATDSSVPTSHPNLYNYPRAMRYFKLGFTESDPDERRKYQAKMLVSVGHLMHLVNDMNVPAHVRDDAHPFGDPLEMWMRGGADGNNEQIGFHVKGNSIKGKIKSNTFLPYRNNTIHKQNTVAQYMTAEADFTSKNFVSKDTLYLDSNSYLPNKSTISYSSYYNIVDGVKKRYIRNRYGTKIAMEINSHLCNNIQKIYYPNNPSRRGKGLCGAPTTLDGDYTVLEESGEVLIKRAMSNATGLLDYFFRGQISAEITYTTIVIKNISDTSLVAKDATIMRAGFLIGIYTFWYEDDDGTRHPLYFTYDRSAGNSDIRDNVTQPNTPTHRLHLVRDLNSGDSIKAHIILDDATKRIIRTKKIIAIYSGDIGQEWERGVAVCQVSRAQGITGTRN